MGKKGKTTSPYRLGERRRRACDMFLQGSSNVEVSEELQVHPDTVARYRRMYEMELKEQAAANPQLLHNALENTVRTLKELDLVRKSAWAEYELSKSPTVRGQMLRIALQAQEQRAKLFNLFGVKTEYFVMVQNVRIVQEKLLTFMSKELCVADREKLAEYLGGEELAAYMGSELPVLDVPSEEVVQAS